MDYFIPYILHDYRRWKKSADLVSFVQGVIDALTGNPDFPAPNPALGIIQAAKDDLEKKSAAALDGGRVAIAERVESHIKLIELVDPLADYVQYSAHGNLTKLTGSGFHLQHAKQKIGELPPPQNFRVRRGINSGEIKIRCKAVHGAKGYEVQYSTTPDDKNSWTTKSFGSTKISLTNLQQGKQYAFRLAAVGSNVSHNFTQQVLLFVA